MPVLAALGLARPRDVSTAGKAQQADADDAQQDAAVRTGQRQLRDGRLRVGDLDVVLRRARGLGDEAGLDLH